MKFINRSPGLIDGRKDDATVAEIDINDGIMFKEDTGLIDPSISQHLELSRAGSEGS